jgi:hypothetical protein
MDRERERRIERTVKTKFPSYALRCLLSVAPCTTKLVRGVFMLSQKFVFIFLDNMNEKQKIRNIF